MLYVWILKFMIWILQNKRNSWFLYGHMCLVTQNVGTLYVINFGDALGEIAA